MSDSSLILHLLLLEACSQHIFHIIRYMHARGMHTMGGHKSTDLFLTNQSREMHSSPAEKNCRNDEKKLQRAKKMCLVERGLVFILRWWEIDLVNGPFCLLSVIHHCPPIDAPGTRRRQIWIYGESPPWMARRANIIAVRGCSDQRSLR